MNLQELAARRLPPETLVWRMGLTQWVPAYRLAELPQYLTAESPPLEPALLPQLSVATDSVLRKPAWNPVALGWLSLIFTPIWAGIMAALNYDRLKLHGPRWRPVSIGFGSLILALMCDVVFDSFFIDMAIYVGATALLWICDFLPQSAVYAVQPQTDNPPRHWLIPTFAGIPAAAVMVLTLIVAFRNTQPVDLTSSFVTADSAAPVAKVKVSWRDATWELQQLLAYLSDEEKALLGLSVLLTGQDVYASRVRIDNTGNVAVRIFPQNIQMHFGQDATTVSTIDHPGFLKAGVLRPNYFIEGLVIYQARVDIGAMIRLGGGQLSYFDRSIDVTY
jgi:hypothetical protein